MLHNSAIALRTRPVHRQNPLLAPDISSPDSALDGPLAEPAAATAATAAAILAAGVAELVRLSCAPWAGAEEARVERSQKGGGCRDVDEAALDAVVVTVSGVLASGGLA